MQLSSRLRFAAAAATLACGAFSAQAGTVVLASDSFSYANSSVVGQNGGTGWTSNWGSALGSANQPSIVGNALTFGRDSDNAAFRSLTATGAAEVLVSFTLSVSGSPQANDFLGLWFDNQSTGTHTDVPNIGLKGNCGGSCAGGLDVFVRTTGTGGSFTTPLVPDVEYHIFGLLQKTAGSSVYNKFSVWVDPTVGEMSSFTGADAVATGASSLSSFNTIGFRTANLGGDNPITVRVDNLSIAAVPEPASVLLAGLGLLAAGAASRRRRA
jgi:hypothetical protein